ncbi:hypothetical protein ASE63_01925 [Bosea sp. Root381]|uniref:hypothetical protein n=1 Tax=Bosea sp. Root381 TaxID=1736524 RepID=UPI0006F2022C|nr:hypothetical protein [Bosea sp. Root381]KRE17972.1 hypothetical protein ASE63_01925 [Bosea sp. Root381]
MMKSLAFVAALALFPAGAFAQDTGLVIRDPAGGWTRDPALGGAASVRGTIYYAPPLTRDPAGGTMIDDSPRYRSYVVERPMPAYGYGRPVMMRPVMPDYDAYYDYDDIPDGYGRADYPYRW